MGKGEKWEATVVPSKSTLVSLLVYVDDIKMVGRKKRLAPMWAKLRKKIDLQDPAPFIGQVYMGTCDQRLARFISYVHCTIDF